MNDALVRLTHRVLRSIAPQTKSRHETEVHWVRDCRGGTVNDTCTRKSLLQFNYLDSSLGTTTVLSLPRFTIVVQSNEGMCEEELY